MASQRTLRRAIRVTLSQIHRRPLPTCPLTTSKQAHPSLIHTHQQGNDTLFSFTSGRWLWDEAAQRRKRYQPFNVDELKQAAARAVKADFCVSITKLAEGSYNKAVLLTMENDIQVIAKIPNPYNTQKFATASEVATLDFLRNELGIPVPRVFAWSSRKGQPVGVEYIIMEKAAGNELGKSWPTIDISDKVDIVTQLAGIQATIVSVDFGHYGSLFYKEDIKGGIHVPGIADGFCIGPSSDIRFWEGERSSMGEFGGPWSSSEAYAIDIARREKEWITRFANPHHRADPLRQSNSQESPNCHIALLNKCLKVVPHLIPSNSGQNRSALWHSDLHVANIFVKGNQIVSIIDWQGCSSLPSFHACRIPKFLKVNGSLLFDLPPAAGLAPQEKEEILRRYQLTQLQRHYISKFREDDGDVFPAASFPQALTRQQLVDFAAYTWGDDGLYLFREMMLRACREREGLTGQPQFTCPVKFDTHVIALHDAEGKSWKDCRDSFGAHGLPIDGWVHPEDFEEKLAIVRDLVSSAIDAADDKDAAREHIRSSETVGVWTQRITVEPW